MVELMNMGAAAPLQLYSDGVVPMIRTAHQRTSYVHKVSEMGI